MVRLVEFATGTWLEGADNDVSHEAQTLCKLLTQGVLDAVLALRMLEQVASTPRPSRSTAWEHERKLRWKREEEIAVEDPRDFGAPDYSEWRNRISEQARRDVLRAKWAAGELPHELNDRLPFLHAQTFVSALAQVGRTLHELGKLDTDGGVRAELVGARDDFDAALPTLKPVRDSVEHAEDRMRGRDRGGQKLTLAPVNSGAVNAPSGGVLICGMLSGRDFGWTADDGSYQKVEVSDATIEAARAAVQRALDALPWQQHGYPRYVPSS